MVESNDDDVVGESAVAPNPPPPPPATTQASPSSTPKKGLPSTKKGPTPPVRPKKQWEKRQRQSGKTTDHRPNMCSSLGDMCRLMIRMAFKENTLSMDEPVAFYDFWHKFKVVDPSDKLPLQNVDTRKVSTPRLKVNASSFDMLDKTGRSVVSLHVVDSGERKADPDHQLAPALSDLWKNAHVSMFSSTKVPERQENVPLEGGRSDKDDDVALALLRDSDDEDFDASSNASSVREGGPVLQTGGEGHPIGRPGGEKKGSKTSSMASLRKSATNDKQKKETGMLAASMLHTELEKARQVTEMSLRSECGDQSDEVMDHLMDDSFLLDAMSYGLLPDSAFVPDFDYFNEDPLRLEKAAETSRGKHAKKDKQSRRRSASETTLEITDTESEIGSVNAAECATPSTQVRDDYNTCVMKQRRRIEDRIRSAFARRGPMGDYITPPGEQPLARTGTFIGPGPAAYFPDINSVKAGPVGVFLVKRWTKSIYETPGPGPAAYFPNCNKCTGEMLNLHFADRFEKSETVGPGPGQYDTLKYTAAGKDKPRALVLSRRPEKKVGCGGSKYVNIYGFNQFGKRNPPKALILSRRVPKEMVKPGPGAGDPYAAEDKRVGILIKSRIPPIGSQGETPGYLNLPPLIGQGPGISLGIRKFPNLHADSPGPIYQIPHNDPKPVTMTFKPFPMPGREEEPSPLHYGTKPGDQAVKMTKPKGPNPLICGTHDLNYGKGNTPGPNKYKIKDCKCKIGITMKQRYPTSTEETPGPANYDVGRSHVHCPPRAVFQHKWREPKNKTLLEKCDWHVGDEPNTNIMDPCTSLLQSPRDLHRVKGGLLSSRWSQKLEEEESGPGFYDVFGFTNRGKYSKIPISFKSRQSPFVFTHMSKNAEMPNRTSCDTGKINSAATTGQKYC